MVTERYDMKRGTNSSLGLPLEVLLRILGKLDQRQLGVASTVCSTWTRVALLALRSLQLSVSFDNHDMPPYWLRNRAQHLHHLQLCCTSPDIGIHLPLTSTVQLRSLTLHSGALLDVTVEPFLALQHSLTSLSLCSVHVEKQREVLSCIAMLRNLRSLSVVGVVLGRTVTAYDSSEYAEAANSIWANLQHLTKLELDRCRLDDAALMQVTQLKHLQHLALIMNSISNSATLMPLPPGLTLLDLCRNHRTLDCSGLLLHQPMTDLQHLDASILTISNPALLGNLTKLTFLSLDHATVQNHHELLSVLSKLSSLQALGLGYVFSDDAGHVMAQDLGRALQLPHLTRLDLSQNFFGAYDPANPYPPTKLFEGCDMPELLWLHMPMEDSYEVNATLWQQDLQTLADKLPKLQRLNLQNRVDASVTSDGWLVLQQLTGLTELVIGGGEECWQPDDADLQAIAGLTRLEKLYLVGAWRVSEVGLVSLTRLTRLTELQLEGLNSDELPEELNLTWMQNLYLQRKDSGGEELEVCRQLAHRLRNTVPFLKNQQLLLEEKLQAARQEADEQRQQLAAADRYVAAAKTTILNCRREATVARSQVAAAQEELAAARRQIAELQMAINIGQTPQ